MLNDDIYKKLRCIFLVLAIISMIIALAKKVHAEEIDNTLVEKYYNETFLSSSNINDLSFLNNLIDNGYNYFIEIKYNNDINIYWITKGRTAIPYGFNINNQTFYCNPNMTFGSYETYYNASDGRDLLTSIGKGGIIGYLITYNHNNNSIEFCSAMQWDNSSDGTIANYNGIGYYNFVAGETIYYNAVRTNSLYNYSNVTRNNIDISLDNTKANYNNYWFKQYTNSGNILVGDNYFNLSEYYPSTNTNGFSVFKYNNLGIDTLRIVPPKNKVQVGTHISNSSTVTFDLNIDETTIPTTFNSDSDYYFESMEYNIAYYEIPFSALLPSSINDFSNVYVTNVVYNNEWGNQGGETGSDTFYYIDKVYLKQTIENEDIGQVAIAHVDSQTGYDETHITDIYNMITNASTISGDFDTEKNLAGGSSTPYNFTSFQDAVVKTVECYHPTGTKLTDWKPFISENSISIDSGDNMYWLEYDSSKDGFLNNIYNYNISPYTYIRENNYTGYYDILYFIVHEHVYTSNGTGFSTLSNTYTRYYYFISDRYYNKLILYREMDIMEYVELNNKISEKIYNYLYDRLLNIDDNIYYYIKNKANIDNDILTALENIDNDMQFNFDIINDILNRILNALSDLHLTQLDTIETKLNTIISNIGLSNTINEDDTVAEAIQYYKSHNNNGVPTSQVYIDDKMSIWISGKVHLWLQGTDANSDKTNLINSVFDTLTSIYDSMKNNNDIFPNIQYFLDAIAKNNNYGYETHGDYMTRLFKGNVDISTYNGISE